MRNESSRGKVPIPMEEEVKGCEKSLAKHFAQSLDERRLVCMYEYNVSVIKPRLVLVESKRKKRRKTKESGEKSYKNYIIRFSLSTKDTRKKLEKRF